jgi:hypothetical protein
LGEFVRHNAIEFTGNNRELEDAVLDVGVSHPA